VRTECLVAGCKRRAGYAGIAFRAGGLKVSGGFCNRHEDRMLKRIKALIPRERFTEDVNRLHPRKRYNGDE
jgi:predicted sugar kinase